jgi:hypothetical protein
MFNSITPPHKMLDVHYLLYIFYLKKLLYRYPS